MLHSFENKKPRIGKDTFIAASSQIIGNVKIGDNCYIGHGVIIRADYGTIQIGDRTAVEEGVIIHAQPEDNCAIGDGVIIGHGAIVHAKSIGNFAVIGMGSVTSIGSLIGEGSIIGEGAIVKQRQQIPAGVVAVGNPVRITGKVSPESRSFWDRGIEIYIDLARRYLEQNLEK